MDNLLEERCRVTWRAWSESVRKKCAEKDAFVENLQEKFNILESDFRYNLNLLKIRENELVRSRNEALQVHDLCQEKSQQVEALEAQVQHLETTLNQLRASNAKNKNNREKLVLLLHNLQSEFATSQKALASQNRLIKEKDEEIKHLSRELEVKRKENSVLDEKLLKFERQIHLIGEKFVQMDSTSAHNLVQMDSKLLDLQKENCQLKSNLDQMVQAKSHADEMIANLSETLEQLEGESEMREHLDVIRRDLEAQLAAVIKENVKIKEKLNNMAEEVVIVNENRNELISVVSDLKLENQRQAQLDTRYQQIVQQNEILKDVIRNLRRENDQNAINEEIVSDLEEKVEVLKDAFKQMAQVERCDTDSSD